MSVNYTRESYLSRYHYKCLINSRLITRSQCETFSLALQPISVINIQPQKYEASPLAVRGAFTVGKDMQPGDYVLQIIVEDPTKKGSRQYAVQWVDFQIAN